MMSSQPSLQLANFSFFDELELGRLLTTGSMLRRGVSLAWKRLIPRPDPLHGVPCGRSSHGLSVLKNGKQLILYGGENIPRTPVEKDQTTWAAEENDDGEWSWRLIKSPCPPARVAHAQSVLGDCVYSFGGRVGVEMKEKPMNDLWKLDCSGEAGTEEWMAVEPDLENGDEPPEARSFHKMVTIGSSLYVFGGCGSSGRLADLHRFDSTTSSWLNLPASTLLQGRGGANFMTFGSEKCLGVVAGFRGEESNDGHLFDVCTETWQEQDINQKLKGLRPRSVCISGSFPSLGVNLIFGGEVDPSAKEHQGAGEFENDLVLLDESDGTYLDSIRGDLDWPEARGWSDGDCLDNGDGVGLMFFFGGLAGDDVNPRRLNDLWRLEIEKE